MATKNVSPVIAQLRARLAGLTANGADRGLIRDARMELREAVAEQRIRELLAAEPPLTAGQRQRLAEMLLES
jgi:hypothetical protein